ncbi:MAG: hypothetical protein ABR567_02060 [Myxococcales bacterium]
MIAIALPVIVCATSAGALGFNRPKLPESMEVGIAGPDLAVYVPASGTLPYVVAPHGRRCKASIGDDGNVAIGVAGVHLELYPATVLFQVISACPYFPSAAKVLDEMYPATRCSKPRADARRVAPNLVRWDGGFVLYEDFRGAAEGRCTLGPRCEALLTAAIESATRFLRYPGSSHRGRVSR